MQHDWQYLGNHLLYLFNLFAYISPALKKFVQDRAQSLMLIAAAWYT